MNYNQKLLAISNGMDIPSLTKLEPISIGETDRVYVYRDDKTLYLGFSPTMDNLKDWARNFFFKKITVEIHGESYSVHAGFALEFFELLPKILGVVAKHNPVNLEISGYSQGGAHAVLAGLFFQKRKSHVTTFASPRCLGTLSSIKAEKKIGVTRVVLRKDPVPHVPMSAMLFRHVGKVFEFGESGVLDIESHYANMYMKALE